MAGVTVETARLNVPTGHALERIWGSLIASARLTDFRADRAGYAWALAWVALAAIGHAVLVGAGRGLPDYLLFLPAVVLAAIRGSVGPALLATGLSLVAAQLVPGLPTVATDAAALTLVCDALLFVATVLVVVALAGLALEARGASGEPEPRATDESAGARDPGRLGGSGERRILEHFAHDLRAPLISVLGFSDVLGEKLGDDATRERAAEAIGRNARRLKQVLDDLLETSAVLAGTARLELGRVELGHELALVVAELSKDASSKGVEIRAPAIETTLAVLADPRRVARILRYLISTAVDTSPPGSTVEISMRTSATGAAVAVADQSASDELESSSPEAPVSRHAERAALNRTVVRQLVALHGGSLHVDRTDAGGGRTVVVFPQHSIEAR